MRIFVTCLGFNRPEVIEGALKNFQETVEPQHDIIKTLFHCGYPLPDPEQNRLRLVELAAEYGWWQTNIVNRGVAENHNQALFEHYHAVKGDVIVLFDPDVRMEQKGWLPAMVEALQADENTVFTFANRHYQDEDWCTHFHGRSISPLPSGLRIARFKCLIAWSMGVYKAEWLNSLGRFQARNPIYGWGEHAMVDLMIEKGKTWCQTVDFYDNHLGSEPLYSQWKVESAEGKTRERFEEWLTKKTP